MFGRVWLGDVSLVFIHFISGVIFLLLLLLCFLPGRSGFLTLRHHSNGIHLFFGLSGQHRGTARFVIFSQPRPCPGIEHLRNGICRLCAVCRSAASWQRLAPFLARNLSELECFGFRKSDACKQEQQRSCEQATSTAAQRDAHMSAQTTPKPKLFYLEFI